MPNPKIAGIFPYTTQAFYAVDLGTFRKGLFAGAADPVGNVLLKKSAALKRHMRNKGVVERATVH